MPTISQILSQATFYTDDTEYEIIQLPPNAVTVAAGILAEVGEPLLGLIVDKDEVTLIIDQETLAEYQRRLIGYKKNATTYRLITIDIPLEPTLVGFMATLSASLANAKVPIFPYSAFSRDHILVPTTHFDQAIQALKQLQEQD